MTAVSTVGNHVAFNTGEYDPSSAEGQHVLAHVRQQTGGAVSMLPQEGELEIDPDERLEREAKETAQRVMRGSKIDVHRMRTSDVHVQRMDAASMQYAAGMLANEQNREMMMAAGKQTAQEAQDAAVEKTDEMTTQQYRLTKGQLKEMVSSVTDPSELGKYMEAKGIEPISSLQESLSSGFRGGMKGWKAGSFAGSFAGPVGTVAGGLAGVPIGYLLSTKFGKQLGGTIQKALRERLGLSTDQQFNTDEQDTDGIVDSIKDRFGGS
ncbi:hypothetical protein C478_12315 [Natrinema thermotolerans DSM 11552]|nr:hypothetical protein C478_12315 [Natrinema thermotolerans DSM 11552]